MDWGEVPNGVLAEEENTNVGVFSFKIGNWLPNSIRSWILGKSNTRPESGQNMAVSSFFFGGGLIYTSK
jgi:hypothetical protein